MEKNLKEICNLMNDTLSNRVAMFNKGGAPYAEEAIREAFFNILGEDKLTHQNWRNHKNEIFTIMEEVLNTNLPLPSE